MKRIALDAVEPNSPCPLEHRALYDSLETTDLAINWYQIAPGTGTPGGLHAHRDQEEIFVVLEGVATFETLDGTVEVSENSAIRFAPGEYHSCVNESDSAVCLLALGAPVDSEDIRLPVECPNCEGPDLKLAGDGDELTFICLACERVYRPLPCPRCGSADLEVTLDDERIVTLCSDCQAVFDSPPMERE